MVDMNERSFTDFGGYKTQAMKKILFLYLKGYEWLNKLTELLQNTWHKIKDIIKCIEWDKR